MAKMLKEEEDKQFGDMEEKLKEFLDEGQNQSQIHNDDDFDV